MRSTLLLLSSCLAPALIGLAVSFHPAPAAAAGAGIELSDKLTPSDVGLPVYPGATVRRDKADDGEGLNLSLWGGSLGFKLALMKFSSSDSVDKVAAFYREALAKHGAVLDCSGPRPIKTATGASEPADKKTLACNRDDKGEPGGRLYKVGTPQQQRVVSIKPVGQRVDFELMKIESSQ